MSPVTLTIFDGERCATSLEDLEAVAHAIARKSQVTPITFPARPVNGGRLELAPAKRGEWAVEPKLNGWRVLVHAPTATAFTRHGERLSIAGEFAAALRTLRGVGECHGIDWFDCEGMERRHGIGRGTLVVLDAVIPGAYRDRRRNLLTAIGEPLPIDIQPPDQSVSLVPSFPMAEASAIYARLRELNHLWHAPFYEGVVMKRADSAYPIQNRSATEEFPGWMKHRFLN
jgi:ATP-dependent DNA ligase